jgi:REP element-mobilizing transposase RayT
MAVGICGALRGGRYECKAARVCEEKNSRSCQPVAVAYDPDRHDRRSMRLPAYDYRWAGAYFVTICTHEKRLLFGEVTRERMRLSPCGRVAADEWHRTAELRESVALDAFVVMPNHVHGIVVITDGPSGNRDSHGNRRDTMHRVYHGGRAGI